MADVLDGGENRLDFRQECLVDRFLGPLRPLANILGVGAARDRRGDVGVSEGKL